MTSSAVHPSDDAVLCHIVPLGDFKEHELTMACWCRPGLHEDYSDVAIHNAMDQRERLESGEIRLQ